MRERFVRTYMDTVPRHRRHARFDIGSLFLWKVYEGSGGVERGVERLLGEHWAVWSTFYGPELIERAAAQSNLAGIAVDSLNPADARALHTRLQGEPWYVGAMQVLPEIPLHVALFLGSLPRTFRIFEDSLYLFHRGYELEVEDNRDFVEFESWENSRIFKDIHWEDNGVRGTIWDPYHDPEYFRRLGELDGLLQGQLSSALDELLIRCTDADPRLTDKLHGAIKSFENHESSEGLAHVSLSCRRFTEQLADCLYPPREEKVNGRSVGKSAYRNRLWAYVSESVTSGTTRTLLVANVEDLGHRIDTLDALANKGLHDQVSTSDVNRLLLSLVVVAHDLLTLRPPGGAFRYDAYAEYIHKVTREELRRRSPERE
ncbi:hypothetical protein ACFV5J_26660 [Streptomyces zaomyceticus]|uniref:hypothetical protein n=1 Tax=Streptomyces zaomyceticus TaxID=68286 RepID=UPI003650740B